MLSTRILLIASSFLLSQLIFASTVLDLTPKPSIQSAAPSKPFNGWLTQQHPNSIDANPILLAEKNETAKINTGNHDMPPSSAVMEGKKDNWWESTIDYLKDTHIYGGFDLGWSHSLSSLDWQEVTQQPASSIDFNSKVSFTFKPDTAFHIGYQLNNTFAVEYMQLKHKDYIYKKIDDAISLLLQQYLDTADNNELGRETSNKTTVMAIRIGGLLGSRLKGNDDIWFKIGRAKVSRTFQISDTTKASASEQVSISIARAEGKTSVNTTYLAIGTDSPFLASDHFGYSTSLATTLKSGDLASNLIFTIGLYAVS
jgi:hypothetical protein